MNTPDHPTTKSKPTQDVSTARHAGRYVLVGASVTVFNFLAYTFIARVIINNNDLLWLSNFIATFITVFVAYFFHSRITWKERNPGKAGVIRFFIWNALLTFPISPFLTWIFTLPTPFHEWVFSISNALSLPFDYNFIQSTDAFVLASAVIMVLNFLFYDKFVFGKSNSQKPKSQKSNPQKESPHEK